MSAGLPSHLPHVPSHPHIPRLSNGGSLEHAHHILTYMSARTSKLYDRPSDTIYLDEIERIMI